MTKDKNSGVEPGFWGGCAKIPNKHYHARVVYSFYYFHIYIIFKAKHLGRYNVENCDFPFEKTVFCKEEFIHLSEHI